MRHTRMAALTLSLVTLLTTLCGCHGSRSQNAFTVPDSFDESRQYEITFWAKNDTNKTQVDIYSKAIADFQALYPNITVKLRLYTDYGKIYNDVITNIATNTTPNVCITYPDHIATYLTGDNVVAPLDALFADEQYGLGGSALRYDGPASEEMISRFLEECSFSGSHYAVPFMRSTEACYVNRTYVEALGYERDRLEVILMQFVRLYQGGELLKMSKRTGTYVTLNELVEEVGRDAARFFFVMRNADSLIDFDMDLAKSQSADNPVYYVQYAHARICSILAQAGDNWQQGKLRPELLSTEAEKQLMLHLAYFPDQVAYAATHRAPHHIAAYLTELASCFHNFYGQCHCLVDDAELMQARLTLVKTAASVLKSGLALLGVSAPEKM